MRKDSATSAAGRPSLVAFWDWRTTHLFCIVCRLVPIPRADAATSAPARRCDLFDHDCTTSMLVSRNIPCMSGFRDRQPGVAVVTTWQASHRFTSGTARGRSAATVSALLTADHSLSLQLGRQIVGPRPRGRTLACICALMCSSDCTMRDAERTA